MRPILVADLFCGAGGSSTGAKRAIERLGRKMLLTCVNHWDRAIETHSRMHPEARHYCMDVASARPIDCVPEGRLDLLMASPTCTYHSRARGGRPTSDQQRMDPWHVITWLTELRVDRLMIENVPEFVDWGPVDPRAGRPIKSKRGQYHREWVATLERLDFVYAWRFINCADHGDATTRRRYFGLGRRRNGRRSVVIKWPEPTHTKEPGHDLLAPLQKWRPARECIDWSLKATSIYGRRRSLTPKSLLRIYDGIVRDGWPERYERRLRAELVRLDVPVPRVRVLARPGMPQPFLLSQASGGAPRLVSEPAPTIVAGGERGSCTALIAPYYSSGSGETCKPVTEPLDAITTRDRFALIVPVTHAGGGNVARTDGQPLPTLTTSKGGHLALAVEDDESDDILYRMLHWRELARAMSFSDVDADYEFAGTAIEIKRQIGNAVPVRTAAALVGAALHDMAGD